MESQHITHIVTNTNTCICINNYMHTHYTKSIIEEGESILLRNAQVHDLGNDIHKGAVSQFTHSDACIKR